MAADATSRVEAALTRLALSRQDESAWSELYRAMWPLVISTTYRELAGSRGEAEDAAQEVFKRLLLYCQFDKFSSASSFRSYVRAMSVNAARDARAATLAREIAYDERDERLLRYSRASGSQEELAIAKDTRQRIAGLLSDQDKRLLELVAGGYRIAEVATQMKLTNTAVGVRLYRLRVRLKRELGDLAKVQTQSKDGRRSPPADADPATQTP